MKVDTNTALRALERSLQGFLQSYGDQPVLVAYGPKYGAVVRLCRGEPLASEQLARVRKALYKAA